MFWIKIKKDGDIKKMQFKREIGFYEKYIKRVLDIFCSGVAILVFCWLYLILALMVRVKLGKPILFKQARPGMIDPKTGKERIFNMYKFRTMTDERDEDGKLLPDEVRLTKFGRMLRATSLDELPEAFNILKGDMSVVGPRPQLVRDMVFMTDKQRKRHTAKPGLSGLAQTRGRNALSWDEKLSTDLEYLENISFLGDVKIIMDTVKQVVFKEKGIEGGTVDEVDITDDFGDYLLKAGKVSEEKYDQKMNEAEELLRM